MHQKDHIVKDWEYRFPWAIEKLKSLKESGIQTVFDIGSGNAVMSENVKSLGLRYGAYDIKAGPDVQTWNVEEAFPYPEQPDAVLFLEVIEHLNNPWTGMKNIANLLPYGGYLILSTPNPAWSDSRISLLRKGVLTMFTQNDLDENHHVFTPWKHVVRKLLHDNGFEICLCETIGTKTHLTAPPFWSPKLFVRLVYRSLKRIIEKTDSEAVGSLYGIVAKKIRTGIVSLLNFTPTLIYEGEQSCYCLL